MAIRALVIDETHNWADFTKVKKLGGRIFGVYLYNDAKATHCCEITPSFELHWAEDVWELPENVRATLDEYEIDEIDQEVIGAHTGRTVSYMHCHTIEGFPERPKDSFELPKEKAHTFEIASNEEEDASDCDEKEWFESCIEYVQQNAIT